MRDLAARNRRPGPTGHGISIASPAFTLACLAPAILTCVSGCSWNALGAGWSNPRKVQIQFYAPPGATVAVRKCWSTSQHEVAAGDADHRLEQAPGQYAVFNLPPGGPYKFKYTAVAGFPNVGIYGELDVYRPHSAEARKFVRQAFVPIALPSRFYESGGDQFYPVLGPSGAGLSRLEVEHLRQGDLIEKVYFVADLQKAWETIRLIDFHTERLRSAEVVLNAELELVDARFESYRRDSLYADPTEDSLARYYDDSGRHKKFIRIEAHRQKLQNQRLAIRHQIDDLANEKRIRTRLLDSMKVVNRRGSLVLATPENQWEFHDAVKQITAARDYPGHATGPAGEFETGDIRIPPLGEPLVVMRVGGRHMKWEEPPNDMVAFSSK